MNYLEFFKKSVRDHASEPALTDCDGTRSVTYAELDLLSGRVAGKLRQSGIRKNSFVLIRMDRRAEYIAAYLGILKAGCAAIPAVPDYPEERIRFLMENSGAASMITESFFDGVGDFAPVEDPAGDDDPALLIYTSGSTGTPKGILYTVGDFARAAARQADLVRTVSPLRFAAAGMFSFAIHILEYFTVMLLGGCSLILPDKTRRSVALTEAFYADHAVTAGFISPQMLRLYQNRADTLRVIITGSERVTQIGKGNGYDVINIYGMSETGIVTAFPIDRPYDNTPIGKALSGAELRVCDDDGNSLPDGEEGEIRICGDFRVTYFRDPERTAAAMIRRNGVTEIRTGDVGFRNENGDLVFVNRRDWMVKINGQRVETLEIETLLLRVPGVGNAAVKAFEDDDRQTYLVAYYVPSSPVGEAGLRGELQKNLPDYMIPRFFVRMDELPKNAHGKLDRNSLLPPRADAYKTEYLAPRTDAERAVCRSFEEVLRCGKVGISDDFFALGGDSIKVLRMIDAAGLDHLTPDMILSGRTPEKIAALCAGKTEDRITHRAEIPPVTPLTEAQRGVYLECADAPESLMYNIPMLCRLPDGTDASRFLAAVRTAVANHPALHITVGTPDGVPSMLYREGEIPVAEKTIRSAEEECHFFVRPFDLEAGPLCRFELCHAPDGDLFLFDVHHLIFDGTSVEVFLSEIAGIYNGVSGNEEELTLFDLSEAEKTLRDTPAYRAAQDFFREKFSGVDCDSSIVPDQIAEPAPTGAGRVILFSGARFDARRVSEFTKSNRVTENTLFLGAFAVALARFNGAAEASFCTVNNGRHEPGLASSVGMFVKTLPIYASIDGGMTIPEYLARTQEDLFRTMRHDRISFGELASEYGVRTGIVFIYQASLFDGAPLGSGRIRVEPLETGDAQSDLDLMMIRSGDGYELMAHYRKSLYTEELIRGFASFYLHVVEEMLRVGTLGEIVLTEPEERALLDRFNATEASYDTKKTVVDLFREQAARTPDAVAVVCRDVSYTYRQLDNVTDRLAGRLVLAGIGKETVTGVLIPRSELIPICSLGVLKAGGAYLPLDPSYPPERLNLMMRDSGASVLIVAEEYRDVITGEFTGERIDAGTVTSLPDAGVPLPTPAPEDLFVMLYTSGSTGLPKGVMFNHSNTAVTTEWVKKYFEMGEDSRVTAYASYGFDAHAFDLYPALTSGAQLHVIPEELRLDFPALRDYFNERGITHTVMTTQIGRQFAQMGGFRTLRHLSVAGEKLTPLPPPDGFRFYNLYGPTEGSIITSAFRVDKAYRDIPIGLPVDNLKAYVVDKAGNLLPAGAVGELWISGPHVTRGYRNRPEKTAEAYGENPFDRTPGYERVYRTGDIVRLTRDGNLQFVGRRDAQVKIRGFRVELTEIEEVIRRYPGVKDATVAAFDDPAGGKFVAAYLVSDEPIPEDLLADFIRAEKPPYMVPAVTMRIDAIPLNQNQKVNRRALPVPVRSVGEIVPPENETQQTIFDVVAEVIGHREFGVTTDIYEAGLTSIGAVRLNVALADAFGLPIRIADVKANPTVRMLEAFVSAAAPETEYKRREDYPLTGEQNGILVECMAAPDTTVYNIPLLLRLGDGVDPERLADAFRRAIDAHPCLKTTLFADADGTVRARRNDGMDARVELIRTDHLPATAELVRPFDLLDSPLYRAAVYATKSGLYLFTDIHHIISDGTSVAVLTEDISAAYAGKVPQTERFTGFEAALEEEAAHSGERYAKAREYWKTRLSGCETDCLPKKAPEGEDGSGSVYLCGGNNADRVSRFCEENHLTLNAFFNGVFACVMSKFLNRESLTYASVYHGRNDSRLARAAALLVKTLPVTAEPDGEKEILPYLRGMQDQLLDGMSNDVCPFAELSHEYGVRADVIFVYQGDGFRFDSLCGEPAERIEIPSGAAKAPITVNVFRNGGRFEYAAEYRRDRYCSAFAGALLDAVEAAALSFLSGKRLRDVSLVSDAAEKTYRILNDSDQELSGAPVHRLFEDCAAKTPDAPAVLTAKETVTYGELNARANRIARALLRAGVGRDSIVGMILEREPNAIAAELGILKAGGAFLPMLPSYPDERIGFCLEDSGSLCVVTSKEIRDARHALFDGEKGYAVMTVDEILSEDGGDDAGDPRVPIQPDQLAYCIYTSGSTGTPKGVMLEHRNFTNFVQTNQKRLEYYREAVPCGSSLALSSFSFDMSLYEVYQPLCSGRGVCICTEDESHNPADLRDLMLRCNVRMMTCTPSFMNNLIGIPEFLPALAPLRTLVVGAEAFPAALYDRLRTLVPGLQIVNGYGPTECSVCCSTKELHSGVNITIGRPTGNMKFFVVDRYGNILPPYGQGELMICGAGVGRGYVRLPEKNAAAFCRLRGLPAYHSGDLVRVNGDAEIEFGGRIDNQVKLRGFRIEPDEIEKAICAFSGVKQSKVVVRNNGTEDYLAGFYTAVGSVDPAELTVFLKSRLTYYMVPAVLTQLDRMPMTANGKIDKNALPETTRTAGTKKEGRRAAKKSVEQRLCEIFASVLGQEEVYADDNFFELGGTSLSASKVTMVLMSEKIEVKYGDIFDHPTPEELAEFIETRDRAKTPSEPAPASSETTRPALRQNTPKYAPGVRREPLGNLLLTGAVGFLGIHVLKEFLELETGHVWCLVRKGSHESALKRLRTMLIYYFSDPFEDALRNRVTVLDADITDESLAATLAEIPFDTVINCAACVKHFSNSDILERINVRGVENLISVCRARNAKLIQISTVSIPGIHTPESYEKQIRMHENELFVIDDMDNKYAISKYHAELRMFDAIEAGMRGKVIRVGNLMGRHSDGEFQVNMETNMFLRGIRGFAIMGKYPISHMTDPMSFSPVDCTARAVVLLAGTDDRFTAFHANNRYGFDEMKIIDACNRNGIPILPEDDKIYYEEFEKKLGDDKVNEGLNGLAAYDIKDAHAVETDNLFTTNVLYRIGFSWPLVDDAYLDRAIRGVMTLDFFNVEDGGEE